MHSRPGTSAALAILTCAIGVFGQEAPAGGRGGRGAGPMGPIQSDRYKATYVKLGANNADGLLYEPLKPGPNSRIAVVGTFPRPTFNPPQATELASRGYRVLW